MTESRDPSRGDALRKTCRFRQVFFFGWESIGYSCDFKGNTNFSMNFSLNGRFCHIS